MTKSMAQSSNLTIDKHITAAGKLWHWKKIKTKPKTPHDSFAKGNQPIQILNNNKHTAPRQDNPQMRMYERPHYIHADGAIRYNGYMHDKIYGTKL